MIDWKRVTELRSEIGDTEFDEVVELFLEEVQGLLDRMRRVPRPDLYEEDLHFLKGCAVNLGFSELAHLCLNGETQAAAGNRAAVNVSGIVECYESSKADFLYGLAAGKAA